MLRIAYCSLVWRKVRPALATRWTWRRDRKQTYAPLTLHCLRHYIRHCPALHYLDRHCLCLHHQVLHFPAHPVTWPSIACTPSIWRFLNQYKHSRSERKCKNGEPSSWTVLLKKCNERLNVIGKNNKVAKSLEI